MSERDTSLCADHSYFIRRLLARVSELEKAMQVMQDLHAYELSKAPTPAPAPMPGFITAAKLAKEVRP